MIQEAECESSARLFQGCGEPSHAKELDTRGLLRPGLPTVTVVDTNSRDTGNVEEAEIDSNGGYCTVFADTMAKLVRGAEVEHRGPGEKLTSPFLGDPVRSRIM